MSKGRRSRRRDVFLGIKYSMIPVTIEPNAAVSPTITLALLMETDD